MGIVNYVKEKTLAKDRANLEKTRYAVLRHLEYGDPLVPKFEEKIEKFCHRYDKTRGEVLASILSDDVAATCFAKSASRQKIAEKSQLEYLRLRGLDIEKLKQMGPECVRLTDGELEVGSYRRPTSTKSIDAKYKNDYIFIKWTDGAGGGQDYAGIDAFRFLESAKEYVRKHDDNVRFVAILDGPYFVKHWQVFTDYRDDRVLVETSDTYRRRGRKPLVINVSGFKTQKTKTV